MVEAEACGPSQRGGGGQVVAEPSGPCGHYGAIQLKGRSLAVRQWVKALRNLQAQLEGSTSGSPFL